VDHVTVLRFYAQHWDRRYGGLSEAPQGRYLEMVRDPQWRDGVQDALNGRRDWVVRRRQAADFFSFAIRSGPKFARFWYQKLRSSTTAGA